MKHATLCMNADGYGLGGRIVVLVIVLGILATNNLKGSTNREMDFNNRIVRRKPLLKHFSFLRIQQGQLFNALHRLLNKKSSIEKIATLNKHFGMETG